jgi:hypothetical protein
MLTLTLSLLLAHLIGDFVLQPTSWVTQKEEKKIKSPYLYWHVLIHWVLTCVLIGFEPKYWIGTIAIAVTHFGIDLAKLYLLKKFNPRLLFFTDQFLHLMVIGAVAYSYSDVSIHVSDLISAPMTLLAIAILCCTVVTSIFMRVIITRWNLEEDTSVNSLKDAGNFIGILERLLILVFILTDHWEGVGFLLGAKSVFRFGDLSRAQDRKMTEYVLIGTMLSFGFAILTGLGYNYLIICIQ